MIFDYTQAEINELARYAETRDRLTARVEELRPLADAKRGTPISELTPEELDNRERYMFALSKLNEYDMNVITPFNNRAWLRAFNEIASDPEAVYQNAIEQLPKLIKNEMRASDADDAPDKLAWFMVWMISKELYLHRQYLRDDAPELLEALDDAIQIEIERNGLYPSDFTQILNLGDAYMSKTPPTVVTQTIKKNQFPTEIVMPTSKIARNAFKGKFGKEWERVGAIPKKDVVTFVRVFDPNDLDDGVQVDRKLNETDGNVFNAIASIAYAGNDGFTDQMIYRVLTGDKNAKLPPKQAKIIRESIDLMRRTFIEINADAEKGYYKNLPTYKHDANMIEVRRSSEYYKGNYIDYYRLLDTPALLQYAEMRKQIARAPIQLLNTSIRKDKETLILHQYLLSRISAIGKLSSTIRIDTICKKLEIAETTPGAARKKKSKIINQTKTILEEWIAQNYIAGYQIKKRGNTIESVEIFTKKE